MTCRPAALVLLLAAALLVSLGQPAFAHRPYTVALETLDFGGGRSATLEILYGDGIFFADPARAQLRTEAGATVAKTSVAGNVVSFCMSVEYCWVFLYGPIPVPWRLDPDRIAWDSPADLNPYPEFDDTPPIGFAVDWAPWSVALGFAVLIVGNWPGLVAMLLPWLLIAAVTRRIGRIERDSVQAWWSVALCALLWMVLILYELMATYVMVALCAFPLLLLALVLAAAMFGLTRLLAWFAGRRAAPAMP
ncbi:hypothetical protein [Dongia sp.]|uniref:hypothetical protein n=1 Tax=Dongia sp. TaxID=1977262 RepID=UPI0037518C07